MCGCRRTKEQVAARREKDAQVQKAIAEKRVQARERRRRQLTSK